MTNKDKRRKGGRRRRLKSVTDPDDIVAHAVEKAIPDMKKSKKMNASGSDEIRKTCAKSTASERKAMKAHRYKKRRREIAMQRYRKLLAEGQDVRIPDNFRKEVSRRKIKDIQMGSKDHVVNHLVGVVTNKETTENYYKRKGYPYKVVKDLCRLDVLILNIDEAVKYIESAQSSWAKVANSGVLVGNTSQRTIHAAHVVWMQGERKFVKCNVEAGSFADGMSLITPGRNIMFKVDKESVSAVRGDVVKVSQCYLAKMQKSEEVRYHWKARIVESLIVADLRQSYELYVANCYATIAKAYDFRMFDKPDDLEMEDLEVVDEDSGETTTVRVPKKIPVDQGDGTIEMVSQRRDSSFYDTHYIMTENFCEHMMPEGTVLQHNFQGSVIRATNKDGTMFMLSANFDLEEAKSYEMKSWRRVDIGVVGFGVKLGSDRKNYLFRPFLITNPMSFSTLMTNSIVKPNEGDMDMDMEEEDEGEGGGGDYFDNYPPMVLTVVHDAKRESMIGEGGWVDREDGESIPDVLDKLSSPAHCLNMSITSVHVLLSVHIQKNGHGIPLTPTQGLSFLMRHRMNKKTSQVRSGVDALLKNICETDDCLNLAKKNDKYPICMSDRMNKVGGNYKGDVFNLSNFCGDAAPFIKDATTPLDGSPGITVASLYMWTATTSFSTEAIHYAMRKDRQKKKIRRCEDVDVDILMQYLMSGTGSTQRIPLPDAEGQHCARELFVIYN